MAFASDDFNIGSGYLVGNSPVVGGTWTDGSEGGSPSPYYDANRIRQQDTATSFTYVATTPSSADYVVQADITPQAGGSGGVAGVIGRKTAGTGAGNYTLYWADYYDHATAGSRQWRLIKAVASSITVLGTYTENIGTSTKTLKLSMVGTAIKLLVDGVERVSVTDSSVTAAGRAGVVFGGAGAPGTNAVYADNWLASDPYTTSTTTYTADAIIKTAGTVTYTADAIIHDRSVTKTYTADAVIEAPVWYEGDTTTYGTAAYTADAVISAAGASAVTKTYTADAIIYAPPYAVTYTADAIVKGLGLLKTYTVDAVISDASSQSTALSWFFRRRRSSMSLPTKTYTSVQAKGTTRTATWTSPTYKSETEAGILVVLDVTAASGTGGLTLRVNAHDLASSVAVPLNSAPTAVTATGTTSYAVYPFGAISGALTQSTSGYLPRQFSITVTHGDSSSYTYSVGYCLLP